MPMTVSPIPQTPLAGLPDALSDASADKRLDVLRRIAGGASISQAARECGISYKAAWQAVETLSALSGQVLVERSVGGAGGGGARITPAGEQLLQLADALAQARAAVLARFAGQAGLGGLAAGLGLRTSMRNQLACRVEALHAETEQDPTVWVQARTAGGVPLCASVTRESADLLGLAPGLGVLLLCKATAVSVSQPHEATALADEALVWCRFNGVVDRVTSGRERDEVVLALPGGGHWVGFAPHPFGLAVGQLAGASVAASALVVALG